MDKSDLRGEKIEKTIFGSLVQALQRPQTIVGNLQADDIETARSSDFYRRGPANSPLSVEACSCRF
jgi:hypothetical protein